VGDFEVATGNRLVTKLYNAARFVYQQETPAGPLAEPLVGV